MRYRITKLYVKGPLKSTTWVDDSDVRYIRARRYTDDDGKYVVVNVEIIGPAPTDLAPPVRRRQLRPLRLVE